MNKQDLHYFKGMQHDMSNSLQSNEFYVDAHNVRITARENGSLLSITNEKGTKDTELDILGVYLGHAIIKNQLVLFTTIKTVKASINGVTNFLHLNTDSIYIIDFDNPEEIKLDLFFQGNLHFDLDHPIQTISFYESEDVQKVYWVDGKNPVRMVNIKADKQFYNYETKFECIQDLQLKETINISRITNSSSNFMHSGTIQYAFTYYHKYGAESNIFYTSPLYYVSPKDRGGSEETKNNVSFKIEFDNLDTNFDYFRIYAIHRTSLEATPEVRLISENRIDKEIHFDVKEDFKLEGRKDIAYSYPGKYRIPCKVKADGEGNIKHPVEVGQFKKVEQDDGIKYYNLEWKSLSESEYSKLLSEKTYNMSGNHAGVRFYKFTKTAFPNIFWKYYDEESKKYVYITWDDSNANSATEIYFSNHLEMKDSSGKYAVPGNGGESPEYIIMHTSITESRPSQKFLTTYEKVEHIVNITQEKQTFIDNGSLGAIIDPSILLYIGGEDIIANTITQKDGTLFLGNISQSRPNALDIKNILQEQFNPEDIENITTSTREVSLEDSIKSDVYSYGTSLNTSYSAGFKLGENYRLGLQFQYRNGRWSDPIHIGDYLVGSNIEDPTYPKVKYSDHSHVQSVTLNTIKAKISTDICKELYEKDYVKVRPVVVFPLEGERRIYCQGMLCPTVFKVENRLNNTAYAQASWFIRPNIPTSGINVTSGYRNIYTGSIVEHRHYFTLWRGAFPGAEIQTFTPHDDLNYYNSLYKPLKDLPFSDSINDNLKNYEDLYFVDQSVLTMHSPDVDFNEAYVGISELPLKLKLVGLIPFNTSAGVSKITTKVGPKSTSGGDERFETNYTFINDSDNIENTQKAARGLVSGFYYKDILNEEKDIENEYRLKRWLVYPWQRSGSITDSPKGDGQKSTLKTKIISNTRFSKDNYWLYNASIKKYRMDNENNLNYTITPVSVFNSNEIGIVNIPNINSNNNTTNSYSYYGNVDAIENALDEYPTYYINESDYVDNPTTNTQNFYNTIVKDKGKGTDPTRIKYKSTPHLVFGFPYENKEGKVLQNILPSINGWNHFTDSIYKQGSNDQEINYHSVYNIEEHDYFETYSPAWEYGMPQKPSINTSKILVNPLKDIYEDDLNDPTITPYLPKEGAIVLISKTEDEKPPYEFAKCIIVDKDLSGNPLQYNFESLNNSEAIQYSNTIYKIYNYKGEYSNGLWQYKATDGGYEVAEIETPSINSNFGYLQKNVTTVSDFNYPFLFLAELYNPNNEIGTNLTLFGGTSEEAFKNNQWIPAGEAIRLDSNPGEDLIIDFIYGDTWYQRYDCLKTYPFDTEDENQLVEIASFMCESRVNIDGRYDKNRGKKSNIYVDRTNFNLWNNVYSQKDNFFKYRILDEDYYKTKKYPNTITWSKQKFPLEETDTWTNISMASTLDLDAAYGALSKLCLFNNEIIAFQDKAFSKVLFNSRVQIPTSDNIPIEISNSYRVDGYRYINANIGCSNPRAIKETPNGIYFIDFSNREIYNYNQELTPLLTKLGLSKWGLNNLGVNQKYWTHSSWYNDEGLLDSNGVYNIYYDGLNKDVYFVNNKTCLIYSESLGQFTSFADYNGATLLLDINGGVYSINSTASLKSYSENIKYESTISNSKLWKNFAGDYCNIFDKQKDFSITVISNQDAQQDKIFNTIDFRGDVLEDGKLAENTIDSAKVSIPQVPFNKIRVWNEYQDTGEVDLKFERNRASNIKQKFRIWRTLIPRNKNSRDRIRNPWINIKLTGNSSKKVELHDLIVNYVI